MKYIWALLITFASAFAEDIYVSESGSGTQNGADAANAHSMTWFNTAGNWDTDVSADGKIGPGDTVHFTGTITSVASVQGSGSSGTGNRITLKIDPGAKFSRPLWPFEGAISAQSKSYIIFEGSNPQAGDGIVVQTDMENTANGTGLANTTGLTRMIYTDGTCSNITVQNMVLDRVYVRTYNHPTDFSDGNGGGTCVSLRGGSNMLVENCYMGNAETAITLGGTAALSDNLVANNNWITDCANGIKPSTISPGNVLTNVRITRNRINWLSRWGCFVPHPNHYHNDAIQTIADPAGSLITGMVVAYNHIGPMVSEPITVHTNVPPYTSAPYDLGGADLFGQPEGSMTDLIFIAANVTGAKVYNNFLELAPGHGCSNPVMGIGNSPAEDGDASAVKHLIANNTIKGGGADTGTHLGYGHFVGNITYGERINTDFHNSPAPNTALNTTANYNIYYAATSVGSDFTIRSPAFDEGNFTDWQSWGFDPNGSATIDPQLNTNGTLQAGSGAIEFAPTQTEFTDDFNGNPRTVPWDAGAFETSSGSTPGIGTLNVQNLRIGP